jgi:uncharacterized protein (DUF1800 family)
VILYIFATITDFKKSFMNRRDFLNLRGKHKTNQVHKVRLADDDLTPYTGEWTSLQATHLLKRTMFGAKYSDIQRFSSMSVNTCVDELLQTFENEPLPPVNNYSPGVEDLNVPTGETWVNDASSISGTLSNNRRYSLHSWWWGLIINQSRTLREKMVFFWHNHLATESTGINPRFLYLYNTCLRSNALGNFKTLLKAMTLNPAMLVYLNGNKNTVGAPNENYARELQELFAIGKGPDSHYTEADVQNAAKVLTGYEINSSTAIYIFKSTKHDTGNKIFSSFYNNTVITGKTGSSGEDELDELLNMLFNQQELSKFICRKIYRYFVYYTIDEKIENQIIIPLAEIFRNNNYEIKPVLSALFKSSHFYNKLNIGCLIKSPVDCLAGLFREFNVIFPDAQLYYSDVYSLWKTFGTLSNNMGQEAGNPPSVAGWPAYYQEPQFHQLWINSNSLPIRNKFSDTMISTGYSKNGRKVIIDTLAFTASLPNPSNPNELINQIVSFLFMVEISQSSKDFLKKEMLLSGQDSDSYWTTAWNNYSNNPTNSGYKSIVQIRLQNLYKYLLDLPEYQLS